MGRAVPPPLHLPSRKEPSFFPGYGDFSSCLEMVLIPVYFLPCSECWGLQWQPLGSRRGKETPETRRDPFLSWEWMLRGRSVGSELRAFPQSPGTPPGCALARSLCRGAALCRTVPVCDLDCGFPAPPHLAPRPTGTLRSPSPSEPVGGEPLLWGVLGEVFRWLLTYFLLLYRSWEW